MMLFLIDLVICLRGCRGEPKGSSIVSNGILHLPLDDCHYTVVGELHRVKLNERVVCCVLRSYGGGRD